MKRSSNFDTAHASQETLALLEILALGEREIEEGRVSPLDEAVARIRSAGRSPETTPPDGAKCPPF